MQQEGGRPPSEVPTPSEVRGLPPVTMQYPASAFDGLSAPNTGLAIRTGDGAALVIQLPEYDTLIGYEWAWRLSALPFRLPFGASVNVVQADAQGAPHLYNGFLHVQGAEPVWTPSGNYISWKVNLTWNEACPVETAGPARICREGEQKRMQTAWYDAQAPHTLVRFDSGHGAVSYILTAIEELHP